MGASARLGLTGGSGDEVLPSCVAGRYGLVRSLGELGVVGTRLIRDVESGEVVVLKVAPASVVPSTTLARLELETQVLNGLGNAGIGRVVDVGVDGEWFFVVRWFVPGVTLREWLGRGRLGLEEALRVARSVVSALGAGHAGGVLHGGIKPENVVVDDGDAGLSAGVLVDFGFSRSSDLAVEDLRRGDASGHYRQRAVYMAPEQAGLLHRAADERSDLYSVGVLLFECLSGSPPFNGRTLGEVLREHLSRRCPTLRSRGVEVPQAVEELVRRLLQKEPDERYQSAHGVLADLDSILQALESGVVEPDVVIGGRDRRRSLTSPAFVGRDLELTVLDESLDHARRTGCELVLIEAASGGGKTRLLDEFEQRVVEQGALVLRGEALGASAQQPLQLLSSVAEGLVQAALADPSLELNLRERLQKDRAILCAMLPELEEVLGSDAGQRSRAWEYDEKRNLGALARFLSAAGRDSQPAVFLLDDCQWADDLTVQLLDFWSHRSDPGNVMVVAAFRSEDVGSDHPLRIRPKARHLRLAPLGGAQVRQMTESMAGALPAEASTLINELSEGNPFLIFALLHGLFESGALLESPVGWRIDTDAVASVQASSQAGIFLAERMGSLSGNVLGLLEAGAVLGRDFDLDLATRLTGQTPEAALEATDEAKRRNLVWVRAARCTFVHDRVREALLQRLDQPSRAELHHRAASEMERDHSGQSHELAYHYAAAGFHDRALPHALAAGELARSRHSLEIAEQQYRIAEQGATTSDHATQARIAEGLGQVLMLRGRYEEAADYLSHAQNLSNDNLTQARLEGELGKLAYKRGDTPEASRRIQEALRMLNHRVPQRRTTLTAALLWEITIQLLRTLTPHQKTPTQQTQQPTLAARTRWQKSRRQPTEEQILVARLYTALVHPWWFDHSTLATSWLGLRQLNAAERYLSGTELAEAYGKVAVCFCAVPLLTSRGDEFIARARQLQEELGDSRGQASAASIHAALLHAEGRNREGVKRSNDAVKLLERAGDPFELDLAAWHGALCCYRLGDVREAVEGAQRLRAAGLELGDVTAAAEGLEIWTKAVNGHVPAELFDEDLAIPAGDVLTHVAALQAKGRWLLAQDHAEEAFRVFAEATTLLDNARMRNAYVVSAYVWLVTAQRQTYETIPAYDPWTRRQHLRQAQRSCRRAVRLARLYRNERPHALREAGLLAALSRRNRKARQLLDRSVKESQRLNARAELGASLEARGRIGLIRKWPGALEDLHRGAAILRELQEPPDLETTPPTLALAEQFDTLLDSGRRVASATSIQEIFSAVHDAGLALLRAEECQVIHIENDRPHGTRRLPPTIQRLIETTIREQRPTRLTSQPNDDPLPPPPPSTEPRSALCVPILDNGRVVACMLATHNQVSDLFRQDEERLAAFITTLAGAAIQRHTLDRETRKQIVAAQEAERRRIARDLHDAIGQALTTVLLGLRMLHTSLETELLADNIALTRLEELRGFTTEAVAEVRRLAFELRPSVLDDLGLVVALRRLTNDLSTRHGLPLAFNETTITQERLETEAETAIYRVVQEALTNVIRHARATNASVLMVQLDDHLRVVIEDDGVGFQTNNATHSFGLRSMTDRANLVDGTLTINSTPGEGTSILLEVPIA